MSTKSPLNDPLSSSISRGKRLKVLRKMSDLSREKMEGKYGISANTIQSWEAAKAGGLTNKGADRIITAFHGEGISCGIEWLLYGIGSPPILRTAERFLINENAASSYATGTLPEDKAIIQELQTFRSLNTNTLDMVVNDNGMLPYYQAGDYVAGKKRVDGAIMHLAGMNCIVEIATNEILLRRIQRCNPAGYYTLSCINPDNTVRQPTLYEQKLLSAAPVIWHRRPDYYVAKKPISKKLRKDEDSKELLDNLIHETA